MSRVLIVEDDPAILSGLKDNLEFESHQVLTAADGEAGYKMLCEHSPDLVILDLMLPKLSGYDLCRRVPGEGFNAPILMLSARSQEGDRVLGLDLGANDYVSKPFSLRELLARVRALLRHEREHRQDEERRNRELEMAAKVQQELFPRVLPEIPGLDYAGICRPARGVSGDYYDFLPLGDGRLGLLVADVSGKGMAAALLGASVHASVRANAPAAGERCGERRSIRLLRQLWLFPREPNPGIEHPFTVHSAAIPLPACRPQIPNRIDQIAEIEGAQKRVRNSVSLHIDKKLDEPLYLGSRLPTAA
jgi:CheY-like chemotaxis protein